MIWPQDLDPKWAKEEDVELTEGEIDNFESIQEEVAMERLEKLTEIIEVRRMARENILAEQKKYKSRYDKMHNPQWFEVGEKVTMQNDRKRGRKGDVLACNRTGPFIIKEVLEHRKTVVLEGLPKPVSVDRLMKYYEARTANIPEADSTSHSIPVDTPSSATLSSASTEYYTPVRSCSEATTTVSSAATSSLSMPDRAPPVLRSSGED
ncbi:hypothetical protein QR680_012650 [Steinernema hermaphroditum]|uniref:Uncharacterized protein n=1 Tax=Steinernema hermaphroditum TaxID=289476 RepID=A0AA39I506_9BILA|nr:hypothetical protein QR680_012650 [Steinernema hermaphroditum]